MNPLKHDLLYTIEVYPLGIAVVPAYGKGGVPMDALSQAIRLLDEKKKAGMDTGISSALEAVFVIGKNENLDKWRKQITDQIALGNTPKDLQWIRGVDTGSSSITLFVHLTSNDQAKSEPAACRVRERGEKYHPFDSDDFGRCLRMIEFMDWRGRIPAAASISKEWENIVVRWDELAVLYKAGKLDEVTGIIKTCIEKEGAK